MCVARARSSQKTFDGFRPRRRDAWNGFGCNRARQ
jgi:hypothetical protein